MRLASSGLSWLAYLYSTVISGELEMLGPEALNPLLGPICLEDAQHLPLLLNTQSSHFPRYSEVALSMVVPVIDSGIISSNHFPITKCVILAN